MVKDQYSKAIEIVIEVLRGFDYVMIGAQAVNAWMVDEDKVRATRDIDFLLDAPEKASVNICRNFRDAGYTVHLKMGDKTDEIPLYIRLVSDIYPQIDIIFAVRSWEKEIVNNGKNIDDFNIKVASVEDIIVLKLVAGSDIDFLDIRNLIKNCPEDINPDAVRKRIIKIDEKLSERLKILKIEGD